MTARAQSLLDEILVQPDPVARNRLITECYRELAEALAEVVGRRDLNWFVFGTWASGTAGAAIRGEGMPLDLGTSRAVAAGNLAIIRDVAPRFLRWLREVELEGAPTPSACERALADTMFDDAPCLAAAIRAYQAAHDRALAAEPRDRARDKEIAELVLLGNVLTGEHEQELVDSFIDAAMPLGGPFGLLTTRFVHIDTPDGPLDVCEDVAPPSYIAPALFPDVLDQLVDPDLCAACERFAQSTGTDASASNALRWEDFEDRMGFILTFFRAYQRDIRFFDVPADYLPSGSVAAKDGGEGARGV